MAGYVTVYYSKLLHGDSVCKNQLVGWKMSWITPMLVASVVDEMKAG